MLHDLTKDDGYAAFTQAAELSRGQRRTQTQRKDVKNPLLAEGNVVNPLMQMFRQHLTAT